MRLGPLGWQAAVLKVVAERVQIWEGCDGEQGCGHTKAS